jgi:predicted TIM-barrel fold metal-dependent hydrolase
VIIDAHIHVGPWDHPDVLGRTCTLEDALAALAAAGAEGGVVMPSDRCDNAALLAEVAAARRRGFGGPLWVLPWVRPSTTPEGRDDLAWVRDHLEEIAGLKVHPSLARARVTDPGFAPALELAAEHGGVVLVHCGRWQEMASYRFAVDAAAAHPTASFLLAHAGGDTPPLATAAAELVAERGIANAWFEFAGLREYWVVERCVERLGADRYLLGSDFPLAHPLMYVGAVRAMKLSEADRDRILGGNARALFGAAGGPT